MTFAIIFMNADKTIYGRYGSRSSVEDAAKEMSVTGLAASMAAALELHAEYPGNMQQLSGKQAIATEFETPDDFPSLRGKFKDTLDYQGAVSKSCMHCHQVRDAHRQVYRSGGKPIPDQLLFPNPAPKVVGLKMDLRRSATVADVTSGSAAEKGGFKPGDEILTLDGQALLSPADIQWVLHNAASSDTLTATIKRGDQSLRRILTLDEGWRRNTDISWRVSSWPLRRMGTGGLLFEEATAAQRQQAKVSSDGLALVVKHVGQYGKHAAAKRAGIRKGDIVVSFDGQAGNMSTSQLLAYAAQHTKPGQQVSIVAMRDGQRMEFTLPMQD